MTDVLAGLQRQFIERCRSDLAELEALVEHPSHPEVIRLVHRLAGTAGSFGFSAVSEAAAGYEAADDDPSRCQALHGLLERLRALPQDV